MGPIQKSKAQAKSKDISPEMVYESAKNTIAQVKGIVKERQKVAKAQPYSAPNFFLAAGTLSDKRSG